MKNFQHTAVAVDCVGDVARRQTRWKQDHRRHGGCVTLVKPKHFERAFETEPPVEGFLEERYKCLGLCDLPATPLQK